ncbi:mucin-2-like [Macrobrachium rosenbergii]|uniref:mucin-2-like n=1 Tax=Macrobrachium rosenbergii TaxID=79674 RepID=UPI0034D3AEFA
MKRPTASIFIVLLLRIISGSAQTDTTTTTTESTTSTDFNLTDASTGTQTVSGTSTPTDSTTGSQTTGTSTLTSGSTTESQTTGTSTLTTGSTTGSQTTETSTLTTGSTTGSQTTGTSTLTAGSTTGSQTTETSTLTTGSTTGSQTTGTSTLTAGSTTGSQTTETSTLTTGSTTGSQTTGTYTLTTGSQTTSTTSIPTDSTTGAQTSATATITTGNTTGAQTSATTSFPTNSTPVAQTTTPTFTIGSTTGAQTTATATLTPSSVPGAQITSTPTITAASATGVQTATASIPTGSTTGAQTIVATTVSTGNTSGVQTVAAATVPSGSTTGAQTIATTSIPAESTSGAQTVAATRIPTANTTGAQTKITTTVLSDSTIKTQTITQTVSRAGGTTKAQTIAPTTKAPTVIPVTSTTKAQTTAPSTVSTRPKGCQNNWISYNNGQSIYKEDCYLYTCLNGVWSNTYQSDPYCCNFWSVFGWNLYYFSREYINWNRFRWWYNNYQWYSEYYYRNDYYITYYGPLNTSIYNSKCQRFACVARDTINITAEIQRDCCKYKETWYHHGQPIYKDDCVGYVCLNGKWVETSYRDPKCCWNPDTNSGFQDYFNDVYDYYDSYQNFFKSWYKLNETRPLAGCQEVKCASRNNWVLTGVVIPDCRIPQGCDFNGTHYSHMSRLPGCFQVYCVRGVWIQRGHVDSRCGYCTAQGDPHLRTFDGHYYDYQGTCEYAIAQNGTTTNPQFAVISQFRPCWSVACIGPSTYKDSPGTVITMGMYGRDPPDLYKILVNGVLYEIPDEIPRFVKEGAIEHPVLAWRYRYWCIRLIGSSQIAMERCGWSVSVWAPPEFRGKLYGLCGYFDGNIYNDFMKRDGTTSMLQYFPRGVDFPDSWETTCASGGLSGALSVPKMRRMERSEAANCTLDKEIEDKLRSQCSQIVEGSGGLPQEMIIPLIDNCVFDVCSIYQNTSGNASAIEEWLGEVQKSAADISDVQNKTTDTDVLPEILFLEPFNVTETPVVTEATEPESSGPPIDKDTYSKREKLMLRLIAEVNIGNCRTSGSKDR